MSVDAEMMKRYSRFAVEEIIRRSNKAGQAPNKSQILKMLVPNYVEVVNEFKSQVKTEAENNAGSA